MPCQALTRSTDFFGRQLDVGDVTLQKLKAEPSNKEQFSGMVSACLNTTVSVLERQYKKDFELDISEKLRKETASARSHNIDAEEILGMYRKESVPVKATDLDFRHKSIPKKCRATPDQFAPWRDIDNYDIQHLREELCDLCRVEKPGLLKHHFDCLLCINVN